MMEMIKYLTFVCQNLAFKIEKQKFLCMKCQKIIT